MKTRLKSRLPASRLPASRLPAATIRELNGKFRLRSHLRNIARETQTSLRAWKSRKNVGRKNRFVLYAASRSGGTMLLDLLRSHPQIAVEDYGWDAELMAFRWIFPYRYAEARAVLADKTTYGFKLKPEELTEIQHIAPPVFLANLHRRGWKIVHLQRHNVLRQAISMEAAVQSEVWHDNDFYTARRDKPMILNPENLLRRLADFSSQSAKEASDLAGLRHLSLVYETDLLPPDAHSDTANKIFDFLGLPPHDVQTHFRRTGTDNISDSVANWSEIEAALRASRFAHFLES